MKIFGFEVESDSIEKIQKFMGLDSPEMGNLEKKVKEKVGSKFKQYDTDAQALEESGGWQGRQDAARHLIGIGETARVAGRPVASFLAKAYEMISGSADEADAAMDEHNNKLAMSLFNAKSYDEVKQRVKKLMEDPQFQDTSDPNRPVINKLE